MLKLILVLAAAGAIAEAADSDVPAPSCQAVPGWAQSGPSRTYDAENLYEYMDGNSEGYLIYGFKKMNGVTCRKGEVAFVIDISDMGDPDLAYGMFTANRDSRKPEQQIGMAGQIVRSTPGGDEHRSHGLLYGERVAAPPEEQRGAPPSAAGAINFLASPGFRSRSG